MNSHESFPASPEIQQPESLRSPQAVEAAAQIIERGYGIVELGPEEVGREVFEIHLEAIQFFEDVERQDETGEAIYRYRTEDDRPLTMSGTRLMRFSDEYADVPEEPDLCDTIALMPADLDKIPNADDLLNERVIQAMLVYRERVQHFAQEVLDELADMYGAEHLSIDPHSFLDMKRYPVNKSDLTYRQKAHTDDGLLTIGMADRPGLQLLDPEGNVIEVGEPSNTRVVVMPGDVLTNLTGGFEENEDGEMVPVEGAIAPQWHEVVNYRDYERFGLYNFVFPDVTKWIDPWVETDANRNLNISKAANESQAQFGMAYLEDPARVPTSR